MQTIFNQIDSIPQTWLWIFLFVSVSITGFIHFTKIQPEWRSKHFQIASEKFDRLCQAYENYCAISCESKESSGASILRFEGALRDYCKTPVHHRIGDIALQSDHPTQALYDISRLKKAITYKDNIFQKTFKPYAFPSKKAQKVWKLASMASYLVLCIAAGSPMIAASFEYMSFAEALLAAISLGYLPFVAFVGCYRSQGRAERLYRFGCMIKENGGRIYGEATPITDPK